MPYIKGTNISFKYDKQVDNLLENLSFEINDKDKIGLTGKNGKGKTTLINIILEKLELRKGNIQKSTNLTIGYLPQEISYQSDFTLEEYLLSFNPKLSELQKNIKNNDNNIKNNSNDIIRLLSEFEQLNGYSYQSEITKLLYKFGFSEIDLERNIESFSGGEKTKAAIFQLLIQEPTILLLDEPTNHLDIATLLWLEEFLSCSDIPYLIISHDREFLDKTVNKIWDLEDKKITSYTGNYSFYKEYKETEYNRKVKEFDKIQKKISQLTSAFEDRKNSAMKREKFKPPRSVKRNGGLCSRDMFGVKNRDEQAMMRSAKAVETRINKEIQKEEAKKPTIDKRYTLNFSNSDLKNKNILKVDNLSKSFGDKIILKNVSLNIELHNRVAITGKNGIGKSTLFKILMNSLSFDSGSFNWAPKARIGYYAQDYENLDFSKTILDEIIGDNINNQSEARNILGKFHITKDKVFDKISTLSIGERTKVSLSKILFNKPDILLLDEPTNHLEIATRETFEEALLNYTGTIIFISHDRYFINKIAKEIIKL